MGQTDGQTSDQCFMLSAMDIPCKKVNNTGTKVASANIKEPKMLNLNLNQLSFLRISHMCVRTVLHNCCKQQSTKQFSWLSSLLSSIQSSLLRGCLLEGRGTAPVLVPIMYMLPNTKKVEVAHTRLPSVGFRSWSRFLAVSLQVRWVINPAVRCHYFPPGLQLPSQPLRGLLPISLLVNRGTMGVNSLPKTVTRQWAFSALSLQCFYTVGWVAGRASGL